MSRRRGAVWLLGGWLLMLPPPRNPSAPLQNWAQEGAFDSEGACEESRRIMPEHLKSMPDGVGSWMYARCVPAESVPSAPKSGSSPSAPKSGSSPSAPKSGSLATLGHSLAPGVLSPSFPYSSRR